MERWNDHLGNIGSLKRINPIEVADYAVANKLVTEPAFVW
jgi:hypothetical protein